MTLRVEISIVPFGDESGKYEIYRLDINNTGLVENLGFGHEICSYEYFLKRPIPEILRVKGGYDYDTEVSGEIERHDRRDGSWSLVNKILDQLKEKKYFNE